MPAMTDTQTIGDVVVPATPPLRLRASNTPAELASLMCSTTSCGRGSLRVRLGQLQEIDHDPQVLVVGTHRETAFDNFVRDFGERFVPGSSAPSVVDLALGAAFDEQRPH